MTYEEKYHTTESSGDKPCTVVGEMLKHTPPSAEPALALCEYGSTKELTEAFTRAWFEAATDRYLLSKNTQTLFPAAKLLLQRAQKIVTAPNMERNMTAAAEGLWLTKYERKALENRRNGVFAEERDAEVYLSAKRKIAAIYGFSNEDMDRIRYCVVQARREDSDPALNRALYIWSAEKMTGKTTVAKIIAGVLNGWRTWQEVTRHAGEYMSDIPNELQFGTFDRPKATRFACVVMDEAFAGKTTAKYYGKFKTAITSDTCAVQVKFGGTYDIRCTRNYIFTSNSDAASVIADESERRIMVVQMNRPEQLPYEEIFAMWRDFVVNAPDEADVAAWYRRTAQVVKGERGVQREDIASAFLSEDFRGKVIEEQSVMNHYQLPFPSFFAQYISGVFDVRGRAEVVKEAVRDVFGEPHISGNRKYYNILAVLDVVNAAVNSVTADGQELQRQDDSMVEDDLPF